MERAILPLWGRIAFCLQSALQRRFDQFSREGRKMAYTIKQMAAMFGVTEHTLRYYTDLGLLSCKRTDSGGRVFDDESVNWMQGI